MVEDQRIKALSQRILQTPGLFELVDKMLNDEAVAITLQPRVEFLASVSIPKSAEDSIFEFFDLMKLSAFSWEHDGKEYRVRADTYLVRVNILPPSNTDPPKADVLLIVIEADDFLELQNIRDMINETDFSNQFRDFILVWDADGAMRAWLSYTSLHVLENQLRKLIISRLMGIEDGKWWDKRIKNPANGKYVKYKKQEVGATDITHYPDEVLSDIFYTDFSALEKVISEQSNWDDAFSRVFMTKKYIQKLGFLNRLRRKIAHNRFLTERNHDDLINLRSVLMRVFRKIWGI